MSENGKIYASMEHKPGKFHHSSFLAGQPVAAARQHCQRLYSGYEPKEIMSLLTQLRWALQNPSYSFQGIFPGVKASNEDILFYFAFLLPVLEQAYPAQSL